MPERWAVALDHPDPAAVQPHHLHALVSRWMDRDHWATTKPYSLVPLHVGPDGRPTFEVGCLTAEASERLAAGVERFHRDGGWLGAAECAPGDAEPQLRSRRSWEAMAEVGAADAGDLVVHFETPTTFRRGNVHHPLPLISSVVRSWNQRWKQLAPSEVASAVDLDASRVQVAVQHLAGTTETWRARDAEVVGFVGEVHYRCHEPRTSRGEVMRRLRALASVAEFAGTGTGTTKGFGVTSVEC